jgi:hypothetical protein
MADAFEQGREFLSDIFMVPAAWFSGPKFITHLIIPYILAVFFFYTLLTKKIRIFRRANAVNFLIAIFMGFSAIPLIVINVSTAMFFSTFGIIFLRNDRITFRRLIFALAIAGIIGWFWLIVAAWLPRLFGIA